MGGIRGSGETLPNLLGFKGDRWGERIVLSHLQDSVNVALELVHLVMIPT